MFKAKESLGTAAKLWLAFIECFAASSLFVISVLTLLPGIPDCCILLVRAVQESSGSVRGTDSSMSFEDI